MKTTWTDICVNLTNKRFDKDREEVINQAVEADVKRMLVTGTNLEHSRQAVKLANAYPDHLKATAGCHPHDAKEMTAASWVALEELIRSPEVVTVGECGLDFDRNFSPADVQLEVFERQIQLAIKYQKPLLLHERSAHDAMLSLLQKYREQLTTLVIHCFTGTREQVKRYIELDIYIGVTGWVCDERRNHDLLDALNDIPLNRLMVETDAPYLTPRNLKPKPKNGRNLPSVVPHIGKELASHYQVSPSELQSITTQNSIDCFNWPL
ncbi:TatD family hydrolase [Pleionea sp. CnH1-48]|uniref:TatD family hydrolase n=1 Tax=Pleionea sp. CnH1-48 TaxID=2954494 RepID=UPI002096FAD2|nr:TatD family hydrolase [Pleionea sp. CnH1-48]MCO7224690.1 TatD family hydrolase [Pleionea sp. CnH1-48]